MLKLLQIVVLLGLALPFTLAAAPRPGQPFDELIASLGRQLRERFYAKDGEFCVPPAIKLKQSAYCHFPVPPNPMEMFSQLVNLWPFTELMTLEVLPEKDPVIAKVTERYFKEIDQNRRGFYQQCAQDPTRFACSGANANPPPSKYQIEAVYRLKLTALAKARIAASGNFKSPYDDSIYLVRFYDGEPVISVMNATAVNTTQEVYLAPDGSFIWHNRFGRLDLM